MVLASVLVALAGVAAPSVAPAKPRVVYAEDWRDSPSARYAALDRDACLTELTDRGIRFERVDRAPGVMAPVRLPAGAAGVLFRTALPAAERAHNPNDVFDCRLALALSDLGAILGGHGVDEVLMSSAWRPPAADFPESQLAKRHPGGLAIDVERLRIAPTAAAPNGRWIDVARSWKAAIGRPPCRDVVSPLEDGVQAGSPARDARTLRAVVCAAADKRLFTSILTPNYDRAHRNHVHLEITPGVAWRLLR